MITLGDLHESKSILTNILFLRITSTAKILLTKQIRK